jgi:hypothetical protein
VTPYGDVEQAVGRIVGKVIVKSLEVLWRVKEREKNR